MVIYVIFIHGIPIPKKKNKQTDPSYLVGGFNPFEKY